MLFCLLVSLLTAPPLSAQARKSIPPIERVTDNLYRIGKVLVDTEARTVSCRGVVNMDSGAIEYLAVGSGGKLHESLLRLDVRPIHLQIGLMLLGLEPKQRLKSQGDPLTPQGTRVQIKVRWIDLSGRREESAAEKWIVVMPGERFMGEIPWVFTGSRILKSGFEADTSRSIAAVWHDPAAIIDNALKSGADNSCFVNSHVVPKRGTTVEFIISCPDNPSPRHKEPTKS